PEVSESPPGERHNLPPQPKSIIGREEELAHARQQLLRESLRLLTLTGPPGVGKTRVALELASNSLDDLDWDVRFVDLAPIADPGLVPEAIARGLGLRELGRRPPVEVVEEFLRDRSVLAILDNFEQVIDAAEVVGRLLAACPKLKVVATSRT